MHWCIAKFNIILYYVTSGQCARGYFNSNTRINLIKSDMQRLDQAPASFSPWRKRMLLRRESKNKNYNNSKKKKKKWANCICLRHVAPDRIWPITSLLSHSLTNQIPVLCLLANQMCFQVTNQLAERESFSPVVPQNCFSVSFDHSRVLKNKEWACKRTNKLSRRPNKRLSPFVWTNQVPSQSTNQRAEKGSSRRVPLPDARRRRRSAVRSNVFVQRIRNF